MVVTVGEGAGFVVVAGGVVADGRVGPTGGVGVVALQTPDDQPGAEADRDQQGDHGEPDQHRRDQAAPGGSS